ncbi:hypothetical protein CFII64_01271 [Pseudomonas sp. CFII64]|nr:hypothetical protein CFII64_01271 [Pseudomonas sp. CFII64]
MCIVRDAVLPAKAGPTATVEQADTSAEDRELLLVVCFFMDSPSLSLAS